MLNSASTLPSGGINLVTLETYLCRSYAVLAKLVIFTHTVHVFDVLSVRSRTRVNEPSTGKDFVDVSIKV